VGLDPRTHAAVETEVLGQARIIKIVRDDLDDLLPEPLDAVLEGEAEQQRTISATRTF
jgi:hypothetical protein